MVIEFDAIYDGKDLFKSKTPIDLPKGTTVLITEIINEGNGRPLVFKGHIVAEVSEAVGKE